MAYDNEVHSYNAIFNSVMTEARTKESGLADDNEVHSYIYPVETVTKVLHSIVQSEVESNEYRNKSSGAILTTSLNMALSKNVHFKNICMLLSSIHGNRNASKMPTKPGLHLTFSNGSEDTSNMYCSNCSCISLQTRKY